MAPEDDERPALAASGPDALDEVEDTGRLLALSDGVFAFAMTLLVINLTIPSAIALSNPPYAGLPTSIAISRYLSSEYGLFSSYVIAFLVIGLWWTTHRRVFRHIRGVDPLLNWTNITFLLFIGVSPFVTGLAGVYGSSGLAVALYSGVNAAAGITIGLIALHVSGRPDLAHPNADRDMLAHTAENSFMIAGIFSVAASVAQYRPDWAQYAYLATAVVIVLSGKDSKRLKRIRARYRPVPLAPVAPGGL